MHIVICIRQLAALVSAVPYVRSDRFELG